MPAEATDHLIHRLGEGIPLQGLVNVPSKHHPTTMGIFHLQQIYMFWWMSKIHKKDDINRNQSQALLNPHTSHGKLGAVSVESSHVDGFPYVDFPYFVLT